MQIEETPLGFEIDTPEYLFFFGKKDANTDNLKATFPNFEFLRVKQTHGCDIHHQINSDSIEADGHWLTESKKALAISTADCCPVLLAHPSSHTIMAIHAGWRGVVSRIVPKGLRLLQEQGAKPDEIFVLMGPHIQQSSFEVGADVKDLLVASAGLTQLTQAHIAKPSPNEGKFLVDINTVVKMQIAEFSVSPDQVFDLHLDTFTDLRFHSYRRDKSASGRQLSFVVRK